MTIQTEQFDVMPPLPVCTVGARMPEHGTAAVAVMLPLWTRPKPVQKHKPFIAFLSLLLLFTCAHGNLEAMKQRARMAAKKRADSEQVDASSMKGGAYASVMMKATQGNANAQFSLGGMYYHGMMAKQDYAKAIIWYTKAAKQGHTKAKYNLGYIYYDGRGVAADYAKAFYWFEQAAGDGDTKAQLYIAQMYYNGRGVEQDYTKALSLYNELAEKEYPKAQQMLGHMYHEGLGIPANSKMAIFYLQKASKQSFGDAQLELAKIYLQNGGAEEEEVIKLLQDAYLNGVQEAKDVLQAHQWALAP